MLEIIIGFVVIVILCLIVVCIITRKKFGGKVKLKFKLSKLFSFEVYIDKPKNSSK